jgi:hypothetical protein
VADYFIDKNRGNDANTGVSKDLAWQTLEKFRAVASAGGIAAGSNVLLESSSVFAESRYLRFGTGTSELLNGTAAARTTIGKYDYSSQYSGHPRVSYVVTPVSGDWTFDGTFGLWYINPPIHYANNNQQWGGHPRVTINGRLCPIVRYQSSSFTRGNLPAQDYEVFTYEATQPGRLYVYSPVGVNPSDYYGAGSIKASSTQRGVFSFSRCGSYLTIQDIELFESGKLATIYSDATSLGDIIGFQLLNNVGTRIGVLADFTSLDGAKKISQLDVSGNRIQSAAGYGFHLSGYFDVARIRSNWHSGGNLARSDGGAVYIQGDSAAAMTGVVVSDNYYEFMAANTKGSESDGCAIYCEVRSANVKIERNTIKDCHWALQDNSGRSNTWVSNLAINCDKLIKISDANNLNAGGETTKVYGNTAILRGNYWQTYGSVDYGVQAMKGPSVAAANYTFDLKNNVMMMEKADATRPNATAFGIESGATLIQSGNAFYGWDKLRTIVGGTTELGLSGAITSDPLLSSAYRPLPGSPLIGAGTHLGYVRDLDGKQRPNPPSIGAYDVANVTTRPRTVG